MVKASMSWKGGLKFEGTGAFGHTLITDASKAAGGNEEGHKPTELLLYGIAGCTGIDIVRILKKMRQDVTDIQIELTGLQNEDYPKPFHTIEVKYTFKGNDLDSAKVAKAIELSDEKYCVVSQTVREVGKVVTSFEIV